MFLTSFLKSYRERVCSGLAKYHGIPADGVERRRRRPSSDGEPRKKSPTKKSSRDSSETERQSQVKVVKVRKRKTPVYKDPLASSKLEMIKSIRAKRVAEESKKMDAVERARLLISEAEKAAKVLEIAAMRSPVAQASLLESKKLIAEATQLIESIEMRQIASSDDDEPNNSLLEEDCESETEEYTNYQEQEGEINGTHTFPINGESLLHLNMRSSDLPTLNIEDIKLGMGPQPNGTRVNPAAECNGAMKLAENHHQPLPNGSKVNYGNEEKAESLESGNVTKKWSIAITKQTQQVSDDDVVEDHFGLIPVHLVIHNIFPRWSVKSVALSRCVSKVWSSIIRHPNYDLLFPITVSTTAPHVLRSEVDLLSYYAPQPQDLDLSLEFTTKP
ncbi:unnamed protein product [Microthlaspi erraticum]|uniref:F-box domain-containing protein n=1 Tax=Microthlaspi erraticum TaxID=1685480 RepID=A0A6D2JY28_9BRAS|nr:unnamed protein product [Microthlaspi erraticum]